MNIIFNILNTLLSSIFNFTGDWGVSIIILTLLVRLALLPISIKQKISLDKQQEMSRKIEDLKRKYSNNKKKLETEMKKHYEESAKGMLGCLVSLLQIPIISSLYFVITKMPAEVGTFIIPWVSSIKIADKYFIIPIIYMLVSMCPGLLSYLNYFKSIKRTRTTKGNLISMAIFSIILTIKAPVAIGLYFITTSLFSLIEEIVYRIYMKNKALT